MKTELESQWMAFTANRAFKSAPRMLVSAKGMYYTSEDGRQLVDGAAGLWCVNAGHGRERIAEAIAEAARNLDFAPGLQFGHPAAFKLANRLAGLVPGLERVFFSNSGSEAVDSALKIVLAYHYARGEKQRVRFVGRQRAYHGVGFGGTSVGGIEANRRVFMPQLMQQVDHLPHTHDLEHNAFTRGQPEWGANFADALEDIIRERGGETIAAVILEPVAGSTGVLPPPLGYLERIRDICTSHGILLVFDEVITGFGRLGTPLATHYFNVKPDLITIAKGLTNACVPMGAVLVRNDIYDTVINSTRNGIEFFHGYTYSGHPLACAAAEATLDIYRDERLFEHAADLAPVWEEAVHSLRDEPHVADIRNIGLMAAVQLEQRGVSPGARAHDVFVQCFENGAVVRLTGENIALSPPLIIEESHIDELLGVLRGALRQVS